MLSKEITITINETPAPKGSVRHIGKGRNIDMQARHHKHTNKTISTAWENHPEHNPNLATYDQPVAVVIEIQLQTPDTAALKKLARHAPDLVPMPASQGNHETTGGDLDKLARAILDCLSGKLFKDDSQVIHLAAYKSYGPKPQTKIKVVYFNYYINAKNYTLAKLQQAQQAMKEIVK